MSGHLRTVPAQAQPTDHEYHHLKGFFFHNGKNYKKLTLVILQICSYRAGPGTAQDTVPCRAARWAEISGTAQPALRAVPARPSFFRAGPGFVPRFSGRARASPLSTAQTYSSICDHCRGALLKVASAL